MALQPLEHLVDISRRLPVIQSDNEAERDEIARERIHEASAKRVERHRPAEGVNHRVERLLRLPDLLYTERENLRVRRGDFLPIHIRLRQRSPCSLGENRYLSRDVGRRSVAAARLSRPRQPGWCRPYATYTGTLSHQRRRGESREHVHSRGFGLLTEPAHHLAERSDVVTVILHRRRRGDPERMPSRQQIDPLSGDRATKRKIAVLEVGEELTHGDRIDYRSRKRVLAERGRLLENANLDIAERSAGFVVTSHEIREL